MGIEIGEHAMRITATLSTDPQMPHWQARLSALPTPEDALAALDDLIARALRESGHEAWAAGRVAIGVALWDGADAARGVVRHMRYVPGWEDFPLAEQLAMRWGGPVRLASAPDVAALAEAHQGSGRGQTAMLYEHMVSIVWSP
jgi:predicted NBD/HSP70 family sugar kinase